MEEKRGRILVVDDEPDVVSTLKHFLSLKGYEVMGAFSGEEALMILDKEKVDLVLLDIMMTGVKGGEVARIIKDKYPKTKIVVVTGYSNEVEGLSKENILDGAFIKPINMQELYNKLVDTLSKKNEPPEEKLQAKKGIRARVILIKAKLLFIEPSLEVYKLLNERFQHLSHKGEDYEMDLASGFKEIMAKIESFNPDILVANASLLKNSDIDILKEISDKNSTAKEVIIYNGEHIESQINKGLEELTNAIEQACFKNGLIQIKWIDI